MAKASEVRESVILRACMRIHDTMKGRGIPLKLEKQHGSVWGKVGKPDLEGSLAFICLKIELKRPGGTPTEIQKKSLRDWRQVGAVAFWTDSPDVFRDELEALWVQLVEGLRPDPALGRWRWLPATMTILTQLKREDVTA